MVNLEKKVIWITGASSGIGEALAKELIKEDAILILSARRKEELDRVKKECGEAMASKIHVLPFDVTDLDKLPSVAEEAWDFEGKIDILINNAGVSQRSLVKDAVIDIDKKLFQVNYFGPVCLTKALLPKFLDRNEGQVVVISSIAGLIYSPKRSTYSATKYAVEAFFNTLYTELVNTSLKVNIINPGFVNTNISFNSLDGSGNRYNKQSPAQETGIPADVCARKIVKSIRTNKKNTRIAGAKENFGVFMHRFFPKLFDYLITRISST
jgi:short-subunit dehydrogenase